MAAATSVWLQANVKGFSLGFVGISDSQLWLHILEYPGGDFENLSLDVILENKLHGSFRVVMSRCSSDFNTQLGLTGIAT